MTQSRSGPIRWLLIFVRYGLCIAALIYLVYNVPWHDRVHVDDHDPGWYRLLEEQHDDHLIIHRNEQPERITYDQVAHVEVGDKRVPEIVLGFPSVVLQINVLLGLLAALVFLPVPLIQSYRLVLMLRVQGVRLTWWNSVKLTFAGNFFNFALPGMTGGDLIKAYYVTYYTHKKTEVVTTVVLDRAIGLLGLVLLAGVAILLAWDPERFGSMIRVLALICAALAVGSAFVFSKRLRHMLHLPQLAEKLPMGEQLLRIGRATVAMRDHKSLVVSSLLLTLVLQTVVMISATIMAWALGMTGTFHYFFIYVAIGFLIAALPISPPQAVGVMEYFYILFFTAGGANTASQAVALAVAVRLIQLVWAIPGVLVPLLGAHMPKQDELEALQQDEGAPKTVALAGDAAGEPVPSPSATRS